MALANKLVGNAPWVAALEATLTGVSLAFNCESTIAITGATASCTLNGEPVRQHATIDVQANDVLAVGPAEKGVRCYLAVAGGFKAKDVLGSTSTYLTAGFGGHEGRALAAGDELSLRQPGATAPGLETPENFRMPMMDAWILRAGRSCETSGLTNPSELFERGFTISNRSDRMGIQLTGKAFEISSDGQMPSVPVFPGTIQCTEDGSLFMLAVDSGTTGGYPRVAKVARIDLHLMGQLRSGNRLKLIERSDDDAAQELREKHAYWQDWLPEVADVV
jgi:biotin-dependent carboxylase-like uncharacterized protein